MRTRGERQACRVKFSVDVSTQAGLFSCAGIGEVGSEDSTDKEEHLARNVRDDEAEGGGEEDSTTVGSQPRPPLCS